MIFNESRYLVTMRCSNQYASNNVNLCCTAGGIYECICLYLVHPTPNTINADEYFKMWIRIWVSCVLECVYLYCTMLYCLSFIFYIYCSTICIVTISILYHNILITSYTYNGASKAKSAEIKESVSVYCLHVINSKSVVNFSIFTSNWSRLTKRWSGTTLEPLWSL